MANNTQDNNHKEFELYGARQLKTFLNELDPEFKGELTENLKKEAQYLHYLHKRRNAYLKIGKVMIVERKYLELLESLGKSPDDIPILQIQPLKELVWEQYIEENPDWKADCQAEVDASWKLVKQVLLFDSLYERLRQVPEANKLLARGVTDNSKGVRFMKWDGFFRIINRTEDEALVTFIVAEKGRGKTELIYVIIQRSQAAGNWVYTTLLLNKNLPNVYHISKLSECFVDSPTVPSVFRVVIENIRNLGYAIDQRALQYTVNDLYAVYAEAMEPEEAREKAERDAQLALAFSKLKKNAVKDAMKDALRAGKEDSTIGVNLLDSQNIEVVPASVMEIFAKNREKAAGQHYKIPEITANIAADEYGLGKEGKSTTNESTYMGNLFILLRHFYTTVILAKKTLPQDQIVHTHIDILIEPHIRESDTLGDDAEAQKSQWIDVVFKENKQEHVKVTDVKKSNVRPSTKGVDLSLILKVDLDVAELIKYAGMGSKLPPYIPGKEDEFERQMNKFIEKTAQYARTFLDYQELKNHGFTDEQIEKMYGVGDESASVKFAHTCEDCGFVWTSKNSSPQMCPSCKKKPGNINNEMLGPEGEKITEIRNPENAPVDLPSSSDLEELDNGLGDL